LGGRGHGPVYSFIEISAGLLLDRPIDQGQNGDHTTQKQEEGQGY
jgi:hypothetical protein